MAITNFADVQAFFNNFIAANNLAYQVVTNSH